MNIETIKISAVGNKWEQLLRIHSFTSEEAYSFQFDPGKKVSN